MIALKSHGEVAKMRRASVIVGEILGELSGMVKPGVSTRDLDQAAEIGIARRGARPAFKNYRVGENVFPAVLCTSINEEIVHGIPSNRTLREGDIIGLDFGVVYEGYFADSAVTVPVGRIDADAARLIDTTRRCLNAGIEQMWPGRRIGDIGAAVQAVAESAGYGVVRDFVGHGIGRALHEDPQVPNFGVAGRGRALKEGMVLAVEPMINEGSPAVRMLNDGWTAVTEDGKRSAHFEHTIAVTKDGPVVLTSVN
ncbi:MAG: type I methionyl aminopeptidase [Myxococcales bacterium]|nr:MAG: type I methionyl aminopeptidase [Myxococcales bacterium]